jgi:uronate dehydrogenase
MRGVDAARLVVDDTLESALGNHRRSGAPTDNLFPNEEHRSVNIVDGEGLDAALAGCDGVIHLAGISSEGELSAIAAVNVLGTFRVFEAARRTGVGRVVYASSNHAIGFYPSDERIGVDEPCRPDTFYGVSKVAGEATGRLYADKFGLEVACLRIGSYLERPTDRRHLATWASIPDTISAFRAAMTSPDLGFSTFYVVSANRDGYWDLVPGEQLGFVPVDHAEEFEADLGGHVYPTQGGPFSEPKATLDFQRS